MTTTTATGAPRPSPRPRSRPARPAPRLADGVELLGEYHGSAYREPKFLACRPDGQVIALPRALHQLAEQLDGRRDTTAVAAALRAAHGVDIDAAAVERLVETKLRPAGIAAAGPAGGTVASPQPDPLLMLRFRLPVVPAPAVWRVAGVFAPLFRPVVVALGLLAFVAVDVAILSAGFTPLVDAGVGLVQAPATALLVVLFLLVAGMVHECGHVGACRYGGARPGAMGVGIYLVWPAYYSTVTDSYRLSRAGRLRTDLGGVYVNALLMAAAGGTWLATGAPWLLAVTLVLHLETARQFLPSIRLDGYYILSDLVGLPDLFMYLRPVLSGLLPGRPTHPRVAELTPRARRIIVAWVLLVIPFLLSFVVLFVALAPHVLPAAWTALQGHLGTLGAAVRAGDGTVLALHLLQVLFLALPVLGGSLLVALTVRRVGNWMRERPRARTAGGFSALPVAAVPVLLFGLLALAGLDRRAAVPGEAHLAAAAAGVGSWPGIAAEQVAAVAALLGGLGQDGVLDVARAVLLLAGVAGALLLWPVASALRLPGPAAAAVVLLAGLPALLTPVFGAVDPGGLAAFWFAAAAALAGRGRGAAGAAGLAALAGLLTAPVAGVGLLAFAAHAVATRQLLVDWRRGAARVAAAGLGVGAAVVAVATVPLGSHADSPLPFPVLLGVLVIGGTVVVLALRRLGPLRPVATAAAALLAVAAVPGPRSGTAVLIALPLLAVLAGVWGFARSDPRRPGQLRAGLAAGLGLALLACAPAATAAAAPDPDRHALTRWVDGELDPDVGIVAPPLVAAQLAADGVPVQRLGTPGGVVVDREGTDPLFTLAAGPDGQPLTVTAAPAAGAAGPPGPELARNRSLDLTPDAGAALRADAVDRRLTATLAGLAAVHDLAVTAFPAVTGEPGAVPLRRAVITRVDGRPTTDPVAVEILDRWLRGQQPPYRPSGIDPGPDGVTVRYAIDPRSPA